jgi:hypothetical protein
MRTREAVLRIDNVLGSKEAETLQNGFNANPKKTVSWMHADANCPSVISATLCD